MNRSHSLILLYLLTTIAPVLADSGGGGGTAQGAADRASTTELVFIALGVLFTGVGAIAGAVQAWVMLQQWRSGLGDVRPAQATPVNVNVPPVAADTMV